MLLSQGSLSRVTHSFFKTLLPLIESLAAFLVVDRHWLEQSDKRNQPEYGIPQWGLPAIDLGIYPWKSWQRLHGTSCWQQPPCSRIGTPIRRTLPYNPPGAERRRNQETTLAPTFDPRGQLEAASSWSRWCTGWPSICFQFMSVLNVMSSGFRVDWRWGDAGVWRWRGQR